MSHGFRVRAGRLVALALLLFVINPTRPSATGLGNDSHIRMVDDGLKERLEQGLQHSNAFRTLVARLESEPVLVFVRCEPFLSQSISAGALNFVTATQGIRYVLVSIRCSMPSRLQLSLLAHEFQHALEVASNPDIVDAATLGSHYLGAGFQTYDDGRHRGFETDAALAMQHRVDQEVYGGAAQRAGHDLTALLPLQ